MAAEKLCRIEVFRDAPVRTVVAFVRFVNAAGDTVLALPFRLEGERTVVNGVTLDPSARAEIVCAESDARIRVTVTPRGVLYTALRGMAAQIGLSPTMPSAAALAETRAPVTPWRYTAPDSPPSVSIIIPTRDRADLLARAVDTLFLAPQRAATDLVIVDNGSVERSTLEMLERLQSRPDVQILRLDEPFNFARLINAGAGAAKGEVLAFLNNDVESADPHWCDPLVALAMDERVGAAGAKLLYADGRVQHAGITLGIGGLSGHTGRGRRSDDPGPAAMLTTTRQVSAVTGACLFTRRDLFQRLGGFDESYVVEFNDIDYCLRAGEMGFAAVCATTPMLTHNEGSSRA
ncbi:MAG: glycosyltransferase, partial [Alphaproteobacteria bacterium]|nr:glycosyltransferase [Alphaproteobacteria bacterium]